MAILSPFSWLLCQRTRREAIREATFCSIGEIKRMTDGKAFAAAEGFAGEDETTS